MSTRLIPTPLSTLNSHSGNGENVVDFPIFFPNTTFDTMAPERPVILCTFDRFESLTKALASVARSKVPESIQWEVLVVDNNSGDRTKEVVEEFSRRYWL